MFKLAQTVPSKVVAHSAVFSFSQYPSSRALSGVGTLALLKSSALFRPPTDDDDAAELLLLRGKRPYFTQQGTTVLPGEGVNLAVKEQKRPSQSRR